MVVVRRGGAIVADVLPTFDARTAARLGRIYMAPAIVEQRARTRAALAARPGERGLDVGCGPGLLAAELARDVGAQGRIVALDRSADMLAAARERVGDLRVAFVRTDAAALPLAGAGFDFVVAVQVYLYVPAVAAALGEAARVLRPGGRLVVVDTDWDSCVWLTADRARHRRVMEARMGDYADAHLPPRLPRLLRGAGLRLSHAAAIPVLEVRYDPDSFSGGIIAPTREAAIARGMPREEAEAWEADLRGRTGDSDYFFSVNRFLFVATRP
jgi:ubiquinone/menaquinone biosynthesis C-methylase UbiE